MKLITIRSQILNVSEAWDKQYDGWPGPGKKAIGRKLRGLDKQTATAKDVADIIGNTSWAEPQECYECEEKFDVVIEVGQKPDHDSATAQLCVGCLEKAVKLMSTADK